MLTVRHRGWDGDGEWDATVAPPTSHEAAEWTPRMSYDDGLGVVAYWFTLSPSDDDSEEPLDSPVTWFETATGHSGTLSMTPSRSDSAVHS